MHGAAWLMTHADADASAAVAPLLVAKKQQ